MNINNDVLGVSVCIFSYNYEKYIAQAIDSVLKQKTSFKIEIVIGDDCSTDGTRKIIESYQKIHPELIKSILNTRNIGGTRNWINTINACKGKYIAFLDGDDYFIDTQKIQKQYDVLEIDEKAVMCFHGVLEVNDSHPLHNTSVIFPKEIYTIEDFLSTGWFIRTSATFFRNNLIPKEPPSWVYDYPYRYDKILHIFLTLHGYAYNIKEVMGVWRKHSEGMSKIFNGVESTKQEIALQQKLNEYTCKKYKGAITHYYSKLNTGLFLQLLRSKSIFNRTMLKAIVQINYKYLFQHLFKKFNRLDVQRLG